VSPVANLLLHPSRCPLCNRARVVAVPVKLACDSCEAAGLSSCEETLECRACGCVMCRRTADELKQQDARIASMRLAFGGGYE
jgi:hypothetical protein